MAGIADGSVMLDICVTVICDRGECADDDWGDDAGMSNQWLVTAVVTLLNEWIKP